MKVDTISEGKFKELLKRFQPGQMKEKETKQEIQQTKLLAKEIMKPVPKIKDDNQKKDELFLKSSRIKLQSDFTEDNTIFPLRQYFNQRE